jgi:hypothetical protein
MATTDEPAEGKKEVRRRRRKDKVGPIISGEWDRPRSVSFPRAPNVISEKVDDS